MLPLDSPRWAELEHAYGSAHDIPALLIALESFPPEGGNAEPWFSLWSAIAHQGDVYSASFATVPHIVRLLESDPLLATGSFFHLPAWIEICRHRKQIQVPIDLLPAYAAALGKLPHLVAAAAARDWDLEILRSALGAIAVSKGFPQIAEAAMELTPETADKLMKLIFE